MLQRNLVLELTLRPRQPARQIEPRWRRYRKSGAADHDATKPSGGGGGGGGGTLLTWPPARRNRRCLYGDWPSIGSVPASTRDATGTTVADVGGSAQSDGEVCVLPSHITAGGRTAAWRARSSTAAGRACRRGPAGLNRPRAATGRTAFRMGVPLRAETARDGVDEVAPGRAKRTAMGFGALDLRAPIWTGLVSLDEGVWRSLVPLLDRQESPPARISGHCTQHAQSFRKNAGSHSGVPAGRSGTAALTIGVRPAS